MRAPWVTPTRRRSSAGSYNGNVSVTVGENAAAYASFTNGTAIAIEASAYHGYANVTVKGDVFAGAYSAIGVVAQGELGAGVDIYGSVDVQSSHGLAIGIDAASPGAVNIYVGGNVYVDSSYGEAVGVEAETDTTVTTTIAGNLNATGSNGAAVGVEQLAIAPGGTSRLTVDGNVTVEGYYQAVGIITEAYYNYVTIGQNLTVMSDGAAGFDRRRDDLPRREPRHRRQRHRDGLLRQRDHDLYARALDGGNVTVGRRRHSRVWPTATRRASRTPRRAKSM